MRRSSVCIKEQLLLAAAVNAGEYVVVLLKRGSVTALSFLFWSTAHSPGRRGAAQ